MMGYVYKRISELGEVVTGKTPSTDNENFFGGDYPFITPSDINSYSEKKINKTERTISNLGAHVLKGMLLPPDSICFVCIGSTIGKMCKTKCESFTNQQINSIIPNANNDSDYLFYLLRYIKAYFQLIGGGTGSGKGIINKSTFSKTKMYIVDDIDIQRKVASVLSTYDEIIDVNNSRIKTLEKMVENLYKEWFVRLRFSGYEATEFEDGIPTGWKRVKLRDVAIEVDVPVKTENRDQYSHYLPIDKLPSQSMALQEEDEITNAESSLIAFKVGDILFGAMRPYYHKVIIAPFNGLTRTTCFVINSKDPVYRLFLYCLLFQKASIDYATTVSVGSTMPYVRWKDYSRMNILLPDETTIKLFNGIVEPILQRIVDSYEINKNLAKQRDLLLPRLMSGKLVV